MTVEEVRRQIPTLQHMTYMNTGWSGPSPEPVVAQIRSWLDYEVREGPANRHVYLRQDDKKQEVRQAVAKLLHATPEEIALTHNTTEGINIVLNGLDWYQGDEVVTLNVEHPSIMVPLLFLERRRKVRVAVVRLESQDSKATIMEKIDRSLTPRTRLVALSHISYCSGLRLPLAEIAKLVRTRAKAAVILVDAAQSVGQIDIDVKSLDCDFYALPGHKWLLGPDGTGALYIRREMIRQLEPTYVGGCSAKDWSFDGVLEPDRDSVEKFDVSTMSTPLLAGFQAAIEFQDWYGRDKIEGRIKMLAERLRERLLKTPKVYLENPPEPDLRCGLVNFGIEGVTPRELNAALWMHYRVVGRSVKSPASTRLSLHYFNTEEEVDRVADGMEELSSQSWDHSHEDAHDHHHH